jgi:signal peptidase II
MFSTLNDSIRIPLFNGINILATILIILYLRATPLHHLFTRYGLVSVFSGATGNFVDRLHRGYVVDFCAVDWRIFGWQHNFAIFNVADICINIGVICLLIDMFIHRNDPQPEKV